MADRSPYSPCPFCGESSTTWLEFAPKADTTDAFHCPGCRSVWELPIDASPDAARQRLSQRTAQLRRQHETLQKAPFNLDEHANHKRALAIHRADLRRNHPRKTPGDTVH